MLKFIMRKHGAKNKIHNVEEETENNTIMKKNILLHKIMHNKKNLVLPSIHIYL